MGSTTPLNRNKPIIIFDGVCNLCNGLVNFIIDRDPQGKFQFVALQSELAKRILKDSEHLIIEEDTIILIVGQKICIKSNAALHIAKRIRGGWQFLFAFIVIPIFIRDAVYDFVAKNRYRWFGQSDSCRVPTSEIIARFPNSL